ncbi:MAG: M48 family metallopeptidase [Halanaerobiales bacterium]|nr:M48 family metallopeptidase [Halanaerobiales bacterium]
MNTDEFKNLFDHKRREKAKRYHKQKNRYFLFNSLVKILLVIIFFYYNFETELFKITNFNIWYPVKIFIYIFSILLIYQIFVNTLEYFTTYKLRVKYNLTAQDVKDWLIDKMKSFVLNTLLIFIFSWTFIFLHNTYPQKWWIIIAIVLSVFVVLLNYLLPVIILPIFYKLKPYPESELKEKLMKTFDKLDIKIEDIYEINLSSKMTSANAAVIGMGNTRKILLSDNLADRFSFEEIEAILCHEIGHHINNDIYKNLLLQPVIIIITSYIVNLSWPFLINLFAYQNVDVIITLPLLLIFWGVLYSLFTPIQLYLSRKYERKADQFSFEVIDNPMELGRAFAKLADDSLSRLEFNWWEKLYKASHPSIKTRIEKAKNFKKK